MKRLAIIMSLFLLPFFVKAQETEIQKNIKELMELTGAAKIGIQVITQIFSSYEKTYPNVPGEIWADILKEINEYDMIKMIIPIYEKYYTSDEINELINFYKTPLGKKTIEVMPGLTQDSMAVGREWGLKIVEKVNRNLTNKGYNL